MARPPAETPGSPPRPTFEPHRPATPAAPSQPPSEPPAIPPAPPIRPDRDPLRAMAPVFTTLAAIAVTALAIWLPLREAQDESVKHYPSTAYVDVPHGTVRAWHDVRWRLVSMRQIPWKYYSYASPPPTNFVRLRMIVHGVLVGPKAKLSALKADDYLTGDLTDASFKWELRDRDERVWDVTSVSTDALNWKNYKPANGMDVTIYADVPKTRARAAMLVAKFDDAQDDFNLTKTPAPRVTVLRFRR